MGKKKNKAGPPYKVPSDSKFLVVIKPWGLEKANGREEFDDDSVRDINAWFEIMLRNHAPKGTRPKCVYFQRSNLARVIVELPSYVNLSLLLGAHYRPDFLDERLLADRKRDPPKNETTYIYEYDFRNQNHPDRRGFTSAFWTYEKVGPDGFTRVPCLPRDFPVRSPYPRPQYIPYPPELGFECRSLIRPLPPPPITLEPPPGTPVLSPQTSAAEEAPPTPTPEPPATLAFTEYERPGHLPERVSHTPTPEVLERRTGSAIPVPPVPEAPHSKLGKLDPYEEEEEAERYLRSCTGLATKEEEDVKPFIKDEYMEEDNLTVKHEPGHENEDWGDGGLRRSSSTLSGMNTSRSQTLESRSQTLESTASVQSELPSLKGEAYEPSSALSAAFAKYMFSTTATESVTAPPPPVSRSKQVQVKDEPRDVPLPPTFVKVKDEPKDVKMDSVYTPTELCSRSLTHGQAPLQGAAHSGVKNEPVERSITDLALGYPHRASQQNPPASQRSASRTLSPSRQNSQSTIRGGNGRKVEREPQQTVTGVPPASNVKRSWNEMEKPVNSQFGGMRFKKFRKDGGP